MNLTQQFLRWGLILSLSASAAFIGCQKSEESPLDPGVTISEDDAADMIGNAVAGGLATGGLSQQFSEAAIVAGGGSLPKTLFDTVIVRQRSVGVYSYLYTFRYGYNFFRAGDSLAFLYTMRGIYDTPRMSSDDSASAALHLSHILPPDTVYQVDGTYLRLGTQSSKLRGKNQFSSRLSMTFSDFRISKANRKILSGQMSVVFSARNSTGTSFEYLGTLTIIGDQLASLILNDVTYDVDLATGQVTPA